MQRTVTGVPFTVPVSTGNLFYATVASKNATHGVQWYNFSNTRQPKTYEFIFSKICTTEQKKKTVNLNIIFLKKRNIVMFLRSQTKVIVS